MPGNTYQWCCSHHVSPHLYSTTSVHSAPCFVQDSTYCAKHQQAYICNPRPVMTLLCAEALLLIELVTGTHGTRPRTICSFFRDCSCPTMLRSWLFCLAMSPTSPPAFASSTSGGPSRLQHTGHMSCPCMRQHTRHT